MNLDFSIQTLAITIPVTVANYTLLLEGMCSLLVIMKTCLGGLL